MTSVSTLEAKDQMLETTSVLTNIQTATNYQKQVVMEVQDLEMEIVYVRIVVHHVNGKMIKKPKRRILKRKNPRRKNQKTKNLIKVSSIHW
jgi:hypothetical protein